MILKVIIYCFWYILMVSSNPLKPCPLCQNPYNQIPVVLQPSDSNSYNQASTVQNPLNQAIALQETLNQLLLTKIFTNPSLQKILDPNTKLLNQNGVEISRTPNVINNYFIVPPDFFNVNTTHIKAKNGRAKKKAKPETIIPDTKDVKTKKKSRKRLNNALEVSEIEIPKERERNRNRKKTCSVTNDVTETEDKNSNIRKRKNKKRKHKEEFVVEIPESVEALEIGMKGYELQETKPKKAKKKKNLKDLNEKELIEELNIESPENHERIKETSERRDTRNSKKDNLGRTEIPDEILRSFFPYMNFYYPPNYPFDFEQMYQMPYRRRGKKRKNETHTIEIILKPKKSKETAPETTKDNTDKAPETIINNTEKTVPQTTKETEKENTKTEIKEPPKKETESNINPIPIEQSPELIEIIDIPGNTEIEIIEVPKKSEKFIELVDDTENTEIPELEVEKEPEEPETVIPELGEEVVIPVIVNNRIINDYYPIFYDSYSFEDDSTKNGVKPIIDEKSLDLDAEVFKPIPEKNKEKLKDFDVTETPDTINENEGINFQSPPFLETPDFKTVKYEKNKLSTYSDVKTPHFEEFKPTADVLRVKVPSKNVRPISEHVETSYANSKVRKYGVISDETYEDTSASTISSEDGTYFVVARSLGNIDDYY